MFHFKLNMTFFTFEWFLSLDNHIKSVHGIQNIHLPMTPKANKATLSYEKTPKSTKKHFLSLAEKLEIINLVEKGSKIATIA